MLISQLKGGKCSSENRLTYFKRRRQWHPTPVLLPGKSHGQRSLVGCNPWGCEESDIAATTLNTIISIAMLDDKTGALFTHCYTHNAQNSACQRKEIQ